MANGQWEIRGTFSMLLRWGWRCNPSKLHLLMLVDYCTNTYASVKYEADQWQGACSLHNHDIHTYMFRSCSRPIVDVKSHISFVSLELTLTFWHCGWPWITKIVLEMEYTVKIARKRGQRGIAPDANLEVDVLTFKMTLNQENNIRNGFSSQKYTRKRYYTFFLAKLLRKIMFDIENHIFAYLTLKFTCWPWNVL